MSHRLRSDNEKASVFQMQPELLTIVLIVSKIVHLDLGEIMQRSKITKEKNHKNEVLHVIHYIPVEARSRRSRLSNNDLEVQNISDVQVTVMFYIDLVTYVQKLKST